MDSACGHLLSTDGLVLDKILSYLKTFQLFGVMEVSPLWRRRAAVHILKRKGALLDYQWTCDSTNKIQDLVAYEASLCRKLLASFEPPPFDIECVFYTNCRKPRRNEFGAPRSPWYNTVFHDIVSRVPDSCAVVQLSCEIGIATPINWILPCSSFMRNTDGYITLMIPKKIGVEFIPFYLKPTNEQDGTNKWEFNIENPCKEGKDVKGALLFVGDDLSAGMTSVIEDYSKANLCMIPSLAGVGSRHLMWSSQGVSDETYKSFIGFYIAGSNVEVHTFNDFYSSGSLEQFRLDLDAQTQRSGFVRIGLYFSVDDTVGLSDTHSELNAIREFFPGVLVYGTKSRYIYSTKRRWSSGKTGNEGWCGELPDIRKSYGAVLTILTIYV